MEKELEELVQDRKTLIQALAKNRMTHGFYTLLTDLYPDSAHFIYELLQNAEDMNATNVKFLLSEDGILFEHNGTKRSFNVSDIDAITNIGNNEQKKQDVNSIGKFGVGFKAVFAYTSTPIIHSGRYHFKIVDYFVPEFEGVKPVATCDAEGVEWTKFEIPFNHPKKNSVVAYAECLKGLQALDKSTILFLQNIRKIECKVLKSGTETVGWVERTGDEDNQEGAHTVTINVKSLGTMQTPPSKWLKVHKLIEIVDEKGSKKKLPIAIAYALTRDRKTNKMKICPIAGKVFIYFPAEKESSKLKFHINAPFASTVARDSVQDRSENNTLMEQVSRLVGDSLEEIKKLELMEKSFFEVLPNPKDELTPFYQHISKAICLAFKQNAYLPTKDEKSFVTSVEALRGPATLSNLFAQEDMRTLFGTDKQWIINTLKNSREDDFLQSLGIEIFTYDDFGCAFDNDLFRARTERIFPTKSKNWLKDFYYLCTLAKKNMRIDFRIVIQNMRQMQIIQSSDGAMFRPSDVYLLPYGQEHFTKETPIVDKTFVGSSHILTDSKESEIRLFFKELGVQVYGPKIDIEKRLKRYQGNFDCDDAYFEDILVFAKYNNKNSSSSTFRDSGDSLNFAAYPLFVYKDGGGLHTQRASSLFLGQAYGCNDGEELAKALNGNILWDEYSNRYTIDERDLFIKFVKNCGIKYELTIEKRDARENPLYWKMLCEYNRTRTAYSEGRDYYVPDLDVLLSKGSLTISKIIWRFLLEKGNESFSSYQLAQFKPNRSAGYKTCDSTFIHQLKQAKWLPKERGDELFAPEDVPLDELPKDFKYQQGNKLIQALLIGNKTSSSSQQLSNAQAMAEKHGYKLVAEEKLKQYDAWEAYELAQKKKKESKSLHDQLNIQKPATSSYRDENDDVEIDGAVHNVDKREKQIEKKYNESTSKSPLKRKIAYVVQTSSEDEKERLSGWYRGKCQICGVEIKGRDGTRRFEARNIIRVTDLPEYLRGTIGLAWNSLSLCPNCALKLQVCPCQMNLYDQIVNTRVIPGSSENIALRIELEEKEQFISYIPKHFLTLQKVVNIAERNSSNRGE